MDKKLLSEIKEITKRKEAETSLSQTLNNLQETNKLISDSIEYASLIQHAHLLLLFHYY